MTDAATPLETPTRQQRADGAEARNQLLMAALRLFSAQGFAKTSVRDIAQAAGANVAAIRYYFGDKAGLYRATFFNATDCGHDDPAAFNDPALPLTEALHRLFSGFLQPLKLGEVFEMQLRLQMREMIDPTGLWDEEIKQRIQPHHEALVALLRRHLGPQMPPDEDDLHRLAFSIVGLAVHLFVARDVMQTLRPGLADSGEAIDTWAARLSVFAVGMVHAEATRCGVVLPPPPAPHF